MNLDFMASPVPEQPGLLIRDPYDYSDATLIIPPELVSSLELLDGRSTTLDMRERLVQATGTFDVGELQQHLLDTLDQAGFLHNATYERMRDERHREFAAAEVREPAHAGMAYPATPDEMRQMFSEMMQGAEVSQPEKLIAIAAPHASPGGGWESYRDAYASLSAGHAEKIFVILGTSHYGMPNRFGLTRKRFATPYGETRTETALVDFLAAQAPGSVEMEDYCHATEHSIEFQVAFLQHLYGPSIRVVPVLVGPFYAEDEPSRTPEQDEGVKRFLGALGELHARHAKDLLWVLGVDMAHIGRRYGDRMPAQAHQGQMLEVSARDKERIGKIEAGESAAYWDMVRGSGEDDLKWCGSAPLYSFLKAVPEARGRMLRYQHWQIDPQSVVSFAAMSFEAR